MHWVQGDASDLHIIIFDEIDAICKQRGSVRDGSGELLICGLESGWDLPPAGSELLLVVLGPGWVCRPLVCFAKLGLAAGYPISR